MRKILPVLKGCVLKSVSFHISLSEKVSYIINSFSYFFDHSFCIDIFIVLIIFWIHGKGDIEQ